MASFRANFTFTGSFPEGKLPGRDADPPPPPNWGWRMGRIIPLPPLCACWACDETAIASIKNGTAIASIRNGIRDNVVRTGLEDQGFESWHG